MTIDFKCLDCGKYFKEKVLDADDLKEICPYCKSLNIKRLNKNIWEKK